MNIVMFCIHFLFDAYNSYVFLNINKSGNSSIRILLLSDKQTKKKHKIDCFQSFKQTHSISDIYNFQMIFHIKTCVEITIFFLHFIEYHKRVVRRKDKIFFVKSRQTIFLIFSFSQWKWYGNANLILNTLFFQFSARNSIELYKF